MDNTANLVSQFLEGDDSAFDQLTANYYTFCLNKAYFHVEDREIAKDLTQEALMHAFKNLHQLRDKKAFKWWLSGIVRNVCNNYLRNKKNHPINYQDILPERITDEDDPTILPFLKFRLHKAVNELSELQRTIIQQHYFEGKSVKDIAFEHHLSLSNVKVRLHRARKKLKEKLDPAAFNAMLDTGDHVYLWHKWDWLIGQQMRVLNYDLILVRHSDN